MSTEVVKKRAPVDGEVVPPRMVAFPRKVSLREQYELHGFTRELPLTARDRSCEGEGWISERRGG